MTIRVEVPGCSSKDVQGGLADGIITVTAKASLSGADATQVHQFWVGRKVGDIKAKADDQPTPPQRSVNVSQS